MHSLSSIYLYFELNGPLYANIEAATAAFPGINSNAIFNFPTSVVHLSFSSLNPSVNFFALSNYISQSFI